MAKCSGFIGYIQTQETEPGIWSEVVTEKRYFGDLIRDNRRYSTNSDSTQDDLTISNNISVLSNSFMNDNIGYMKYVTFLNQKWKIASVELNPPRITITLGGLYNE